MWRVLKRFASSEDSKRSNQAMLSRRLIFAEEKKEKLLFVLFVQFACPYTRVYRYTPPHGINLNRISRRTQWFYYRVKKIVYPRRKKQKKPLYTTIRINRFQIKITMSGRWTFLLSLIECALKCNTKRVLTSS